ncbi:MAG: PTS sugar transporter subunit IIA [Verrucomicrobiales bacterium]
MTLASLLSPAQIVPELEATEHWPAIEELVDHLDRQKLLQGAERAAVLEALREREEKTTTGVGYGVAIPHAFSDSTEKVIAAFGRSRAGIEFGALDNAPVRFIILFIVPRDEYHLHLKTLAAIAKMFNNAEIRQQLTEAPDADAILRILSQRPARV